MTQMPLSDCPHVTVVVPCYNRATTLRAAIMSVVTQDYPAIDIVAVDDGSSDTTWDALLALSEELSGGAVPLRVVRNTCGKGAGGARNAGAALTLGDWVAFQDSDDLWMPGKLTAQMAALGPDDLAVYCAMESRDGDTVLGRVPAPGDGPLSGDIQTALARSSFISTQTVVIRRDAFEASGGFDEAMPALEDWELMLRIAGQGPIAYVDRDLVVQQMSANSITRSSERRVEAQEYVLTKHRALLRQDRQGLAHHHHRLAGGHRQFGHSREALRHARAAIALAPWQARYWLGAVRALALRLRA